MTDPMNKLPIDIEWVKKGEAVCTAAAKELGCMVLMVAIQPEGKMNVTLDGVPETGPFHEIAKDVPRMLFNLSLACKAQDDIHKQNPH